MHWRYGTPRAAIFAAVTLACAARACTAQTWSWTYSAATPEVPATFRTQFVPLDAHGFWAVGGRARRYGFDGSLLTVGDSTPFSGLAVPLPGGGFATTSEFYPPEIDFMQPFSCSFAAYAGDGTLAWAQTLPSQFSYCTNLQVDGRATLWLSASGDGLRAFAVDGALLQAHSAVIDFAANLASDGGVFAIVNDPTPRIEFLGGDGSQRWVRSDPSAGTLYDRVAIGSVGNVYAIGRVSASTPTALRVTSYSPAGDLLFAKNSAEQAATIPAFVAAGSGAFYAIAASAQSTDGFATFTVERIADDGSIVWSRTLDNAAACAGELAYCGLVVGAQGDALVIADTGLGTRMWRFDPAGKPLFAAPIALGYTAGATALPDGSVVVSTSTDQATWGLTRYDRNGQTQPAPSAMVPATATSGASAFDADGSSFVLSNAGGGHQVVRLDATGSVVWRVDNSASGISGETITGEGIDAGAGLVCALGARAAGQFDYDFLAECFSSATGEPAWSKTLPQVPYGYPHGWLRVLADGSVVVLHQAAAATEQVVFDASGRQLHSTLTGMNSGYAAIGADGTTVLLAPNFSRLETYDASGALRYSLAVPAGLQGTDPPFSVQLLVLDDGSVIVAIAVASASDITPYAWAVGPSGLTNWLQTLTTPQPRGAESTGYGLRAIAGSSGQAYFETAKATDGGDYLVAVQSRDLSNGHLLWAHPNLASARNGLGSALAVNPASGALVVLLENVQSATASVIDERTGGERRRALLPCAYCDLDRAVLTSGDTLLLDALQRGGAAPSFRLFALRDATAPRASIRIDQPGLNGAWYAPYESGQGFTFDWIAGASTVFMPWFTFAQSGINDPSGLAWYTLQGGGIAPGATSADLAIAVSNAGAFNSGSVAGRQVGTAHLSFSDCNSGTLYYQFDADTNGGAGGLISLIRLTQSTDPCVLADGSTGPAQNVNAPANGFDAKQSGSWYDPTTGGQGMELTIVPAGNGSSGLVFAPWFTFDPSGQSDDTLNQHWFTLQGDLSAAANGKVVLPIYRIIGGSFDAMPTSNFAQVGQATLTMQGCAGAQLDYAFDGSEVAHAFAGLTGSMHLVRIGGCR